MSCGGDGHGHTTGFGGIVSAMATEYGIPIAAARKMAHQVIAARRDHPKAATLPPPTTEQIVAVLEQFAVNTAKRRDNPKPVPPGGKAIPTARWDGYIDAVLNEAKQLQVDPSRRVPDAAELTVWQQMPALMKKFAGDNQCPACGRFVSPYAANAHACPAAKHAAPAATGHTSGPGTALDIRAMYTGQAQASNADPAAAAPQPEPSLATDDTPVAATPLAGMTVGDMRAWIQASQEQAYLEGLHANHPAAAASASASEGVPAGPRVFAIPAPRALPTRPPTVLEPHPPAAPVTAGLPEGVVFADAVKPLRLPLRTRAAAILMRGFGHEHCVRCGQFVEHGGHYCAPRREQPKHHVPLAPVETAAVEPAAARAGEPPEDTFARRAFMNEQRAAARAQRAHQAKTVQRTFTPTTARIAAPYAFRAALIAAPLLLLATPFAMVGAAVAVIVAARTPRWLRERKATTQQALIEHYNRPYFWQRNTAPGPVDEDAYEPSWQGDPRAAADEAYLRAMDEMEMLYGDN